MTDAQRIAQAALVRIYRASEREAGAHLSAVEVDALMSQTVLGELCSMANEEVTETPRLDRP